MSDELVFVCSSRHLRNEAFDEMAVHGNGELDRRDLLQMEQERLVHTLVVGYSHISDVLLEFFQMVE